MVRAATEKQKVKELPMRDILLAVALAWCLWLTWDMNHNYKQDKRSNVVDKMTLAVLRIHQRRLDYFDKVLGVNSENDSKNIIENQADNMQT